MILHKSEKIYKIKNCELKTFAFILTLKENICQTTNKNYRFETIVFFKLQCLIKANFTNENLNTYQFWDHC